MLFNSLPFLAFAVLFFALWPWMRRQNNLKWLWICSMSFLFYGWWDWRFLFLLLGTGSIDYFCGKAILSAPRYRRFWLWFSVISNIGSLVVFKYSAWLVNLFNQACNEWGFVSCHAPAIPEFSLILPIGISFYTFNSLSYTIDLYRGKAEPARNWLHFMAFISFFPHLVAGPVIRARDVLQQLNRRVQTGNLQIYNGIKTCIWGYFQKMVLADNLAVFVNAQFNDHTATDALSWWICMLAFAFQIYFDFNGYSTIARGIAKLCGIHFRLNFNHPYRSGSFSEFWQRWHISLSTFFRDYVYIALGGNRKGRLRTELNRWATMLLSGLWHGANLTFLIWGALHASFLSVENMLKRIPLKPSRFIKALRYPLVLAAVTLAWVFFRSETTAEAMDICAYMLQFKGGGNVRELLMSNGFVWLMLAMLIEYGLPFIRVPRQLPFWAGPLFWALLLAATIYFRGPEQDFIYFQF